MGLFISFKVWLWVMPPKNGRVGGVHRVTKPCEFEAAICGVVARWGGGC